MSNATTLVSSSEERRSNALHDFLVALILRARPYIFDKNSHEDAVAILAAGNAGPDDCEWAERHLCGMVSGTTVTFMQNRPWQS